MGLVPYHDGSGGGGGGGGGEAQIRFALTITRPHKSIRWRCGSRHCHRWSHRGSMVASLFAHSVERCTAQKAVLQKKQQFCDTNHFKRKNRFLQSILVLKPSPISYLNVASLSYLLLKALTFRRLHIAFGHFGPTKKATKVPPRTHTCFSSP